MLVTNAIRNSANSGPSGKYLVFIRKYCVFDIFINIYVILGQSSDGSIGICVALSSVTATPTISKSMITNASFRTKKLPGMSLKLIFLFSYFVW